MAPWSLGRQLSRSCYNVVNSMVPCCLVWCFFAHQAVKAMCVYQEYRRSTATGVGNTALLLLVVLVLLYAVAIHKYKLGYGLLVFTRDSISCSAYMLRQFCLSTLSVCPSVTRVHCIKVTEHIIKILSLSDRPIILLFRHQKLLRKSDGFNPNGGAEYKGLRFSTNMRLYLGHGNRYRHI